MVGQDHILKEFLNLEMVTDDLEGDFSQDFSWNLIQIEDDSIQL